MEWYFIVIIILAVIALAIIGFSYGLYFRIFYNNKKGKPSAYEPLKGKLYTKYEEKSRKYIAEALKIPYEQITLKINRHKTLCARYYFVKEGAPTAIMAHGYRSVGIKDFSGGIQEALRLENNILIIDHQGHNLSSGKTIAFGVTEKDDLMRWIDYINKRNNNPDIYLYGISMGGATVLMASGLNLPSNVKGIVADCPYSSVKEEIKHTVDQMGIKFSLVYPFIYLSALIFARFDMKKGEAADYLKNCKVPVLIIHGSTDDIVPVTSSRKLKEKFPNLITYVEIEDAPHGMSYFTDHEKYVTELEKFLHKCI